eukprot:45177-Eustigmatos_ZCMA.PRE.1
MTIWVSCGPRPLAHVHHRMSILCKHCCRLLTMTADMPVSVMLYAILLTGRNRTAYRITVRQLESLIRLSE